MSQMPKRQCQCGAIISGPCPECKPKRRKQHDRDRGSATQRGYGARWQRVRAAYIARHPLCERCEAGGYTQEARLVHHIDRNARNNNFSNLESLCNECHDIEHKMHRFTSKV